MASSTNLKMYGGAQYHNETFNKRNKHVKYIHPCINKYKQYKDKIGKFILANMSLKGSIG